MTNEVKVAITNAVYEVYSHTTDPYEARVLYDETVAFTMPTDLGNINKVVKIVRSREKTGIFYKLYINEDKIPFMTVFGCWPVGFVADIFIKTLEHYYDWY